MSAEEYSVICKVIEDFPDYRVWRFGVIESLYFEKRKTLKQATTHKGYRCVYLKNGDIRKKFTVHKLVLQAFVSKKPNGLQCCHNDGNKANNNASNLRWDTCKNNSLDKIKHGIHANQRRWWRSKGRIITDDDSLEIYELSKTLTDLAVAKKYGILESAVWRIRTKCTTRNSLKDLPPIFKRKHVAKVRPVL